LFYLRTLTWASSIRPCDVVDGDNRPVNPLINLPFDQWWFHGHLNNPPAPGKFFELPAGGAATAEIARAKSITSFADDGKSWGGKVDNAAGEVCPGEPGESFKDTIAEFHTTGFDDLTGCALAITYESDVSKVQPEVCACRAHRCQALTQALRQDFAVFSVNHTCVWVRDTKFEVPARMPPCPEGGCICAWFWIHSPDSGGEQSARSRLASSAEADVVRAQTT
jgi:hypothetical protein